MGSHLMLFLTAHGMSAQIIIRARAYRGYGISYRMSIQDTATLTAAYCYTYQHTHTMYRCTHVICFTYRDIGSTNQHRNHRRSVVQLFTRTCIPYGCTPTHYTYAQTRQPSLVELIRAKSNTFRLLQGSGVRIHVSSVPHPKPTHFALFLAGTQ